MGFSKSPYSVARATRIAKLAPGVTVPVVVIGDYRERRRHFPMREGSIMSESETRAELFAASKRCRDRSRDAGRRAHVRGRDPYDLHGRGLGRRDAEGPRPRGSSAAASRPRSSSESDEAEPA